MFYIYYHQKTYTHLSNTFFLLLAYSYTVLNLRLIAFDNVSVMVAPADMWDLASLSSYPDINPLLKYTGQLTCLASTAWKPVLWLPMMCILILSITRWFRIVWFAPIYASDYKACCE